MGIGNIGKMNENGKGWFWHVLTPHRSDLEFQTAGERLSFFSSLVDLATSRLSTIWIKMVHGGFLSHLLSLATGCILQHISSRRLAAPLAVRPWNPARWVQTLEWHWDLPETNGKTVAASHMVTGWCPVPSRKQGKLDFRVEPATYRLTMIND